MTAFSPSRSHGGKWFGHSDPRPGQLGPGWEVALSIRGAQIQTGCLQNPFPLEQNVKIWGGAGDTPHLDLKASPLGLGPRLWALSSTAGSDSRNGMLGPGETGTALGMAGRGLAWVTAPAVVPREQQPLLAVLQGAGRVSQAHRITGTPWPQLVTHTQTHRELQSQTHPGDSNTRSSTLTNKATAPGLPQPYIQAPRPLTSRPTCRHSHSPSSAGVLGQAGGQAEGCVWAGLAG